MRKPNDDLERSGCEYVIVHAKWRTSRGKGPSMPYCGIRNPKKALEEATKDYHFYSEDFDLVGEEIQWAEKDENRCLQSPLLNNFRIFASDPKQKDDMVETFFWVVVSCAVEDCGTALTVLVLHRNELAKKVVFKILMETTV